MIPRFRNGKSILLCRRQLRLISKLFKFERQFSGQLRIAGTNYVPSKAALIRGEGAASSRADGWSEEPAWVTPTRGGFGCFFGEGSVVFYFPTVLSVCACVCVCVCVCVRWGRYGTFLIIFHCQNESSEQDRMDGASRENSWALFQRIRLDILHLAFPQIEIKFY